MKLLPKISIVIPSYNKVKYIGETLESIIRQNYPNLEVIIQDPGSTDGSLEIIRTYEKKYHNVIKLYKEKDDGQLDAINKGLSKAKGELLAFINADDVYEKGSLRIVGEYFRTNPNTIWLAGRGRVIDGGGREITRHITTYKNLLLMINYYPLLLMVNYLMQPSVFMSTKVFEKYGLFRGNTRFIMEYELWLRVGRSKMPAVINKYLSSFRIPERSFSKDEFDKTLSEDWKIVKLHTNNPFVLALHFIHNWGRKMVVKNV
ncbi:hypothetical protein A3A76_03730 [Candidatus Woesebacteria bacterium RIFCSPLOWO2_01_FULL_39_23]|uniref:Glycosyltransferase 2-like domain-containing protein n=1 Tax=Candidatus Woesebacteria bacterium RIFCSPHIGHO2_01_FULL_40_22 TaxID=1802499 RepID=A0A1F7YJN5_9BACT|nr:MAG: hypothetical protein A2141_00295 [Candidatus Woesebacteria bacterium RBG_16_40_11]OGM27564.1 MAG: hypothetical protein A2628_02130 [Candidatus Woesebacteria bacterium RIFCSPHIGHO2_01_FULL_40_22]OGM36718.1 MAG: hypothetical protein A3E41_02975 [Candidatus Woesebacteria bacterium RIFCSPHIGHO2_12_FULL_38_9]OGM62738.1 MAG: hypothetical protein A3A76_03730 [Candidatus Woesebacteria bacterium RIFCSPLOWO2_01_FULL_39_23]